VEEVRVTGLDSDGVALISPLAATFDSKVEGIAAPGMADVVRDAKPYVVIVSNNTARTIAAFTISSNVPSLFGWTMVWIDGDPEPAPEHIENQILTAPNAVGSTGLDFGERSERGILPGKERLVGLGFDIPAVRPKFEQLPPGWDDDRVWNWGVSTTKELVERIKSQGAGTRLTKIKLDAVVFDDGLLIGPDTEGRLSRTLEGRVKVQQDLYRQILDRLKNGASAGEAFSLPPEGPPDWQGPDGLIATFRPEAISTVHRLRKKYGDDKIRGILQQAILKEPFLIHRE